MRILIVVHGFPPSAQGGTELYAEAHARELTRRYGDSVLVLTREQDPGRPEYAIRRESRDGFTMLSVNNTFRHVRAFADTYANDTIGAIAAAAIDAFRPDVAHVHHLTCLSTTIVPALADRGIPCLFTLHDYWLLCHRGQLLNVHLQPCAGPGHSGCGACLGPAGTAGPTGFAAATVLRAVERRLPDAAGRSLRAAAARVGAHLARGRTTGEEQARLDHMRRVCERVTRFLAPSRCLRDRFVAFGVPADRITLAEYGVSAREGPRKGRTASRPLRLGFVGSLMVSKAPHLLLEAFHRLPAGTASVDLFGAFAAYHGDVSYARRIEPLLRRPGVRAHGAWPHDRIADVFSAIDVLVVPSIWAENSPFVIREAFAAGVPVVASRTGGIPETVRHGVNGLLFEPASAGALREALARLIDEPDLLETLRRGITPVRTLDQDVAFTRSLYTAEPGPAA